MNALFAGCEGGAGLGVPGPVGTGVGGRTARRLRSGEAATDVPGLAGAERTGERGSAPAAAPGPVAEPPRRRHRYRGMPTFYGQL